MWRKYIAVFALLIVLDSVIYLFAFRTSFGILGPVLLGATAIVLVTVIANKFFYSRRLHRIEFVGRYVPEQTFAALPREQPEKQNEPFGSPSSDNNLDVTLDEEDSLEAALEAQEMVNFLLARAAREKAAFQVNLQSAAETRDQSQQTRDEQVPDEAEEADETMSIWKDILRDAGSPEPLVDFSLEVLGLEAQAAYADYQATGKSENLSRALKLWQEILTFLPPGSPSRLAFLNNLGAGLYDRYTRTGELADLEQALQVYQEALMLAPPDSPHRPMILNNLGDGLRARYTRIRELADLEQALQAYQAAVDETPPGSPDRPAYLNNLGIGLSEHYASTGELPDLEQALQAYQAAMDETPPGSPHRPILLNSLGVGLRARYVRTGTLADLERALQMYQEALTLAPPSSPHRPMLLHNLGNGLRACYVRTGTQVDLEQALQAYQAAVDETPPKASDRPSRLNSLGNGLYALYECTGTLADLERALQMYQEALTLVLPDSPHRPMILNNLGNGLDAHYDRTEASVDLEQALQAYQAAVEETPPGSPARPDYLNNLGNGLRARYLRTGASVDLEQALQAYQAAMDGTPPGSPSRLAYLNNLGVGLYDCYTHTGELADLERAIIVWESAWALLQATFATLPVAYKLGQQHQRMGMYRRLVSAHLELAAIHQPSALASYRRALEVAEGSKSRLLTQLVGRGALSPPAAIPLEVVIREQKLLDELTTLDATELAAHDHPVTAQEGTERVRRLHRRQEGLKELEQIWTTIVQSCPEGADYVALRRGDVLSWTDLFRLANELGPQTALLSLFNTPEHTLLFLLRAGWEVPQVVQISLNQTGWTDLLERFFQEVPGSAGDSRRGETWDRSLQQLLELAITHLEGVERLILVPEGAGHLLPWSVVIQRIGWCGPDGHPLPLVTLPALGLLPRLRRRPHSFDGPPLVAGNPENNLPATEQEAGAVGTLLGTIPLLGSQATKAAVLAHLSEASIIHLATHASFDTASPLEASIVLADGRLTAREMLEQHLQAELVVLSACQTGRAEMLGGEELAGLAQVLLYAGARSLIVSLWNVNDSATAALMLAFYNAYRDGADKAQALCQAMNQVQSDPRWTHPYYWGAFVLLGD